MGILRTWGNVAEVMAVFLRVVFQTRFFLSHGFIYQGFLSYSEFSASSCKIKREDI